MSSDSERPPLSAVIARSLNAIITLAKAEISAYKAALVSKIKDTAVAIALFAVAAIIAVHAIVFLHVAAYQALTLAFPGWLAALILAGGLLVLVFLLVIIAKSVLGRRSAPSATDVSANIKTKVAESFESATADVPDSLHDGPDSEEAAS